VRPVDKPRIRIGSAQTALTPRRANS
jgi:hypothetical protein